MVAETEWNDATPAALLARLVIAEIGQIDPRPSLHAGGSSASAATGALPAPPNDQTTHTCRQRPARRVVGVLLPSVTPAPNRLCVAASDPGGGRSDGENPWAGAWPVAGSVRQTGLQPDDNMRFLKPAAQLVIQIGSNYPTGTRRRRS